MRIQTKLQAALTGVAALAAVGLTQAAELAETETNHPITSSQYLFEAASDITIAGVIGNGGGEDLDYYTFQAQAGDVVTIDIDGGVTGDSGTDVDTVLAVFGPGPDYELLALNDDAMPLDPGSIIPADARIDDFLIEETGRYTVGVSSFPRYFIAGGSVLDGNIVFTGSYQLSITGASPSEKIVGIRVKPGSDDLAPLNPKSKGKIPVAIISSPGFDALTVDTSTLTFGATGTENSLHKCSRVGEDVNGDGRVDLVCRFFNDKAGWDTIPEGTAQTEGTVMGKTVDGVAFKGTGPLKVVPMKR